MCVETVQYVVGTVGHAYYYHIHDHMSHDPCHSRVALPRYWYSVAFWVAFLFYETSHRMTHLIVHRSDQKQNNERYLHSMDHALIYNLVC